MGRSFIVLLGFTKPTNETGNNGLNAIELKMDDMFKFCLRIRGYTVSI